MAPPQQKPHDPVTVIQKSAAKEAEKADQRATQEAFTTFVALLVIGHFVGHLLLTRSGLSGYLHHLVGLFRMLKEYPYLAGVVVLNLMALRHGIHLWRHRYDEKERILPEYPPVPDLRYCNDIYIGSGYTYDGRQPGEILKPGEELLEPHVIFNEKGLFGNLHVKGGIGSGKTSTMIYPFLDQAIMKYPLPHPPEYFSIGRDGRYAPVGPAAGEDPYDRDRWNPYVGMTPEEARVRYAELVEQHERLKWGLLVFDPKGDITEFVMQSAIAAGREDDVIVLRPDSEWTYNPLAVSKKDLVMSERFMDGIEAVTGATMHAHYRQTGSEWMANALSIMRAVNPARVTFKTLLTMARKEDLRTQWVNQALAKMREYQEEEERHRRLGRRYTGPRINPAAIEFMQHWDEIDADPTQKRAVVSGIKAQAKFFVDDELAPWLCPDMPPTFKGFHEAIDRGQIVVFQMPISDYATVSRVLGILLLMDFQSAALSRLDPDNPINKERVFAAVIDEVANYLNSETKKFISMNRQARVVNVFAHQSQGQLIQEGDKGFEVSFNDNLRSKISYSAPNHVAAGKESQLFGKRHVVKERYSESSTIQGAVRLDGGDTIKGRGETKGATVSMEEVERSWFTAEEFMSMKTGECVVSEFDGNTTKLPRKVQAPALWNTDRGRKLMSIEVTPPSRPPHPLLHVTGTETDVEYLDTGLSLTGFIFVETLSNRSGEPTGIKFVTEAGTLIVPLEILRRTPEIYEVIGTRLSDAQGVVVLTDRVASAAILQEDCNARFQRVVMLPEALYVTTEDVTIPLASNLVPDLPADRADFRSLFRAVTGTTLPYGVKGAWEYHTSTERGRAREITETSRLYLSLYEAIGARLAEAGEDFVEDLYDRMLTDLETLLSEKANVVEQEDSESDVPPERHPRKAPADNAGSRERVTSSAPRKTPAKKTAKKTPSRPRRKKKSDPGTPPLFDLEDLNDVLKPSPFEPYGPTDSTDDPNGGAPDAGDPDGSDDAGPGGERADQDADQFDPDILPEEGFPEDFPADENWTPEDNYPADDDLLSEE